MKTFDLKFIEAVPNGLSQMPFIAKTNRCKYLVDKSTIYQSFRLKIIALSTELQSTCCNWMAKWMHIIYSLLSIQLVNSLEYFLKCHILRMLKFNSASHTHGFEQLTYGTDQILYTYFDSFAFAEIILFALQNSKSEYQMHRQKIEWHGNQRGVWFR